MPPEPSTTPFSTERQARIERILENESKTEEGCSEDEWDDVLCRATRGAAEALQDWSHPVPVFEEDPMCPGTHGSACATGERRSIIPEHPYWGGEVYVAQIRYAELCEACAAQSLRNMLQTPDDHKSDSDSADDLYA